MDEAERALLVASYEVGQAQRVLEDAQERWRAALDAAFKNKCLHRNRHTSAVGGSETASWWCPDCKESGTIPLTGAGKK